MDPLERDKQESTRQGVGRGSRAWLQHDSKELRRPHAASSNQSSAGSVSSLNADNLEEKKSLLSPQAAEFVPRYAQQLQSPSSQIPQHTIPKSSVQDRIRIARETPPNVYVSQFLMENHVCQDIPQQCNTQQDSEIANYDNYDNCNSEGHNYWYDNKEASEEEEVYNYEILKHLESIIKTLIMSPAEFTTLVPSFVNKLKSDENTRCQQMIIATIMESAMTESNFLYNGARFCKYLDTSAKTATDRVIYREMLYYQCKLDTELQELNWHNEDQRDQRRCNGLILFLSELVAQMDESYAFLIGELLVWLISRVLLKPASNSVKHICQALKLAGRILEKDEHRKEEMENMMRALTELVNNGQVDMHIGNMVNSVHELRKDWRKSASCSLSETNNLSSNDNNSQQQPEQSSTSSTRDFFETDTALPRQGDKSLNLPVMYGPDGDILSAEESQFLQDHIRMDPDDHETSEETSVDDNYDDELATAYEEFLRDTPK